MKTRACPCGEKCDCPKPVPRRSRRREAVLKAMLSAPAHMTAGEICRAAGGHMPGIGIATVYRSLKCLCGCGKAVEFKRGKSPSVYGIPLRRSGHAHLVCRECGNASEMPLPGAEKLGRRVSAGTGFSPFGSRLEIYGICAKCNRKGTARGNV